MKALCLEEVAPDVHRFDFGEGRCKVSRYLQIDSANPYPTKCGNDSIANR